MSNHRALLLIALLIATVAVAGLLSLDGVSLDRAAGRDTADSAKTQQPNKGKPLPRVRVITAATSSIARTLTLTGSVEPYRVARLASPAEGPVIAVKVREADQVATDDILVSIGRKQGAEALILSLREALKKEASNLSRVRQLIASQALSAEDLDQASAAYEQVRAALIQAEETARDYDIKAPWPGVVSRVEVKVGEFVAPRTVLLELYDSASLVIRAAIPERHAAAVSTGMPVEVHLDAVPDRAISSRIERLYPYLDSRLRTRTVEIALPPSVDRLPGMFARLTLLLETAEAAVVVPVEALIDTPKGSIIFVVEGGKALARAVETGIEADNRVQIVSGIQVGDKVVVAGNERLKDSTEVQIAPAKTPTKTPAQTPAQTRAEPTAEGSSRAGDGQ